MPVSFASSTSDEATAHNTRGRQQTEDRPTGSAGSGSLDAIATTQQQDISSRSIGAASGGVVPAPASQQPGGVEQASAPSAVRLTKDEADRLYEENIEEEYAKREGGA